MIIDYVFSVFCNVLVCTTFWYKPLSVCKRAFARHKELTMRFAFWHEKKGRFCVEKHVNLPLKGYSVVRIHPRGRKRRLASFYLHEKLIFEKARKTEIKREKPRKSSVFRVASFCDAQYGGGRWIRTTEGEASRFTVCPLWPLGNSPIRYSVLTRAEPAGAGGRI